MKKKVKKTVKKTENEVATEVVGKSTIGNENRQLFWLFAIIIFVFASILIPYFWAQSSKSFNFGEINWTVQKYDKPVGLVYHGRFLSISNSSLYYNIFLRGDPRTNNVSTNGTFNVFRYGGIISISPKADICRGNAPRAMFDLGAFLRQGIGVAKLEGGSTNKTIAEESENRIYATCENTFNRTLVVVRMGEDRVVQDSENPSCYTIYIKNCDDVSSIEKFMVKSITDFRKEAKNE